MTATSNPILVGIIAGLAAAVLMAAGGYTPFFSVMLSCAALTAIFIAGLGYGLVAGLIAIATASIANSFLYSSVDSLLFTAVPLLPGVVMCYLANLARPATEIGGPDTAMAWYPLSDILLAGAVLTAAATMTVLALHPNMELLYQAVSEAASQMISELSPDMPVSAEMKGQTASLLRIIWPMVQSAQMLIALFAGFYFAVRILSAAGKNTRPREDIRSSLRMNRLSIVVFFAGLALSFTGGIAMTIGSSLAGAVAGGFLLSGFAIIHNWMRDKSWGLPGLIIVYLVTLIFPPLVFLIAIVGGLANPRRAIALTPTKPNIDTTPQT